MLYSIKDREDLEKLNELVSLENQVKVVRLQDKLGKKIFMRIWENYLNLSLNLLKIFLKR